MAQEKHSQLETDGGIIITNNVEVTAQGGAPESPLSLHRPRTSSTVSHNISISSICDSDSESSEPSSLSPEYLAAEMQRPDITEIVRQQLSQTPSEAPFPAKIATIAIKDSTDITFGNKTNYHGPVTIKQFIVDKEKWVGGGVENGAFEGTLDCDGANDASRNQKCDDEALVRPLYRNRWVLAGLCVFFVLLTFGLAAILVIPTSKGNNTPIGLGDGEDNRKNIPIDSNIDEVQPNKTVTLRIVTRDEWLAQPPNTDLEPLELPNLMVIIAHTATENCSTQAECTFRVRYIQTFHIESRNWDDIGYNWLVGGDGQVYEGRGWTKQGAHTKGYNRRSICIAFIGTFNRIQPPQRQIEAAHRLIDEGVQLGMLTSDYKMYGHRQLMATESPGDELYGLITAWPHWTDQVITT